MEKHSKSQETVALTIGFFDGVHRGHRSLLQTLSDSADNSYLVTFSKHPKEILNRTTISLLTTFHEKISLIKFYAPKTKILLLPFSKELSDLSPDLFLFAIKKLIPFTKLIIGHDTRIGKDGLGDLPYLRLLGKDLNFDVVAVPAILANNQVISSRAIRVAIMSGDLELAKTFLGRDYSISGTVIKGRAQGTIIGYPTANINPMNICTPPNGVYAGEIIIEGEPILKGTIHIGISPTFQRNSKLLETYIFDFDKCLYGKQMTVRFKRFIREERKFKSILELSDAIKNDVLSVKEYFYSLM
ncbi:MAG: bifunctional riboflavin kinase/FAD synthetase [Victivallaceae bacterium]